MSLGDVVIPQHQVVAAPVISSTSDSIAERAIKVDPSMANEAY